MGRRKSANGTKSADHSHQHGHQTGIVKTITNDSPQAVAAATVSAVAAKLVQQHISEPLDIPTPVAVLPSTPPAPAAMGNRAGAAVPDMAGAFSPYIVLVCGMPSGSDEAAIASLFAGLQIRRHGVHIICDADGLPTGEAFVEFAEARDARLAEMCGDEATGLEVLASSPEEILMACGVYEGETHPQLPSPRPIFEVSPR